MGTFWEQPYGTVPSGVTTVLWECPQTHSSCVPLTGGTQTRTGLLPQPPQGAQCWWPGPRLHHLLRLLAHRGLHLHRDGRGDPEAVGAGAGPWTPHFWGMAGWVGGVPALIPPPFFCRFPSDLLLTSSSGELWRMVRIGGQPLGFGERGRRARPLPHGGAGVWAPSPSSQHPSHPPQHGNPPCCHPCVPCQCFPLVSPATWWLPVAVTPGSPRDTLPPPDECGIVAQIAEPLAAVDISAYYISTFNFDHALVSPRGTWHRGQEGPGVPSMGLTGSLSPQVPEEGITEVIQLLQKRQESGR